MTGWRAVCQRQTTRGTCSVQEWSSHINILELLAVKPALLVFTKERHVKSVHFQIAKTDLRYVLKMGGTKNQKLIRLKSKEIWECGLSLGSLLQQSTCVMNTMADLESREDKHLSKWKLNHQLFQKTCQAFWKTRDWSPCISPFTSISPIYCIEDRSFQSGNRCNATELVQKFCMHFPNFV